jgi:aminoglycoside phosphotransferase (APT) family kinase protein
MTTDPRSGGLPIPATLSPEAAELAPRLLRAAAARLGGDRVEGVQRLSGGASQETWSFDLLRGEERLELILRRAPPAGRGATSITPAVEAELQRVAGAAGVPVARVWFDLAAGDGLGEGYVMERVAGETIARKILRDDAFAAARRSLARQCGRVLGRIHNVPVGAVAGLREADGPRQLESYRALYAGLDEPRPLFDLAFSWLAGRLGTSGTSCLVHGDFRNGNLVVGPEGLRAVLDWELAHLGDAYEDLSWICVNSWRFGEAANPVGGFGPYGELFAGYQEETGRQVDPGRLRSWEVFGSLKWGVMCLMQGFSHLAGRSRSVEKAAIGRRVSETEVDLARLLARGPQDRPPAPPETLATAETSRPWGRGERPGIVDLVAAVREQLETDSRATPDGNAAFQRRVAANALGIVERELREGSRVEAQEAERLRAFVDGAPADDVRALNLALATSIRAGDLHLETPGLLAHLALTAEEKLRIDNPRYRPLPWP